MTLGRIRSRAAALLPLVIIVAVCVIDVAGGPGFVVIALVVIAPLLAASIVGPRLTGIYAMAAFAGAGAVSIWDQIVGPPSEENQTAMVVRLVGVALGGGIAVAASVVRQARERRMTALVQVAEAARRAILNPVPAVVDGLRFTAMYRSAAVEAAVGGDLYEVLDTWWGVRLLVGDVRGKGLDAVRLANRVLGCFRALAGRLEDPAELVAALDSEVARLGRGNGEDFVTAVVAQVDHAGRMLLLNAGHPDPLLVRAGRVTALGVPNRQPPLGLGVAPRAAPFLLFQSDQVLFYTDGLVEARNPRTREFFPVIPAVQNAFTDARLPEGTARLVDALIEWTDGSLSDDIALVAMERLVARVRASTS
ncbi:Serine phosphatase RsbU, regulator of sigma subunit [Parafrankia irregularis]|uniref:Serine phosphatase RsbU, regulator of sigma subunit n=1 Tax=Parafrankia irregularis TaxID=795642 RepID=A0A0S4QL28_9ACTN|nr:MULTISPECIES: PP2C family protein-serine/threonine phosphatase [Parafrankia]MBE3201304.1 serine/threonine-protein phosphatase [Parafrankia sp. CH37]CUU56247.1 Serine phosphatase RsbU, regulator of sigma subunit [Parafrankia irregularis]